MTLEGEDHLKKVRTAVRNLTEGLKDNRTNKRRTNEHKD